MKTTFKFNHLTFLTLFLLVFTCSDNDDGYSNDGINAQNLITTIDENPTNNQSVGMVQAVGSGTLNFSITSQTPNGALNINPSTGELTVADASLFDFETNAVISGNVSIINQSNSATATVAVNLNNLDDIESFLTTSKADYTAASDGDWIKITETEYNTLASSLNEVTKVATSDEEYDFNDAIIPSTIGFTIANNNGHTIPNDSYVYAFKFYASSIASNSQIIISEGDIQGTYVELGGTLPTTTENENQFYILKGNDTTTNSLAYLGFFNEARMGLKNVPSAGNYAFDGDDNLSINLPNTFTNDVTVLYQGLSTTQKQW